MVVAVLDALLGGVAVEHAPADGALDHLAQRQGCFEPVAIGDRHSPSGNLGGRELTKGKAAERGGGLAQQPPEPVDPLHALGIAAAGPVTERP